MAGSNRPGRIFISYRREDTAWTTLPLYEQLEHRFGPKQVFKDIDSIDLGDDFVDEIYKAVASCDVLLAMIGKQWLSSNDEDGRPRLSDPDDFVRIEIEAALKRNVRVIPILVDGARMPCADKLPSSMAKLVRKQALELSPTHFRSQMTKLLKKLDDELKKAWPQEGAISESTSSKPRKPAPSSKPKKPARSVDPSKPMIVVHGSPGVVYDEVVAFVKQVTKKMVLAFVRYQSAGEEAYSLDTSKLDVSKLSRETVSKISKFGMTVPSHWSLKGAFLVVTEDELVKSENDVREKTGHATREERLAVLAQRLALQKQSRALYISDPLGKYRVTVARRSIPINRRYGISFDDAGRWRASLARKLAAVDIEVDYSE